LKEKWERQRGQELEKEITVRNDRGTFGRGKDFRKSRGK